MGFGDDARGEAGGAGGLEDEGGEVEVGVGDGEGVEDWYGVGGQVVELFCCEDGGQSVLFLVLLFKEGLWVGFTVASSDRDVDLRSTSWGASSVVRARGATAMKRSAYFIVNGGE